MEKKAIKKNILISYFGYEHDQLEYKVQDRTFLASFGKDAKTKGYLTRLSQKDIKRTDIWRPSVALASYPDLKFDDYYLLYSGLRGPMRRTFDEVVEDIKALRPKVNLHIEEMAFKSPWDMVSVFTNLYKFAEAHASEFSAEGTMCYVNCNHGTMQIRESLFMLSQEGKIPGMRILPSPWHDNTKRDYRTPVGSYAKDDPSDFNEAYRKLSIATKRQAKNNGLMEGIFVDKSNTEFLELLNQIFFVAQRTKEPILFTGPTGSGKSNLARNIAKTKGLKDKFVSVNCATLGGDPGIIKSELFGHDMGDFTGAISTCDGKLQQANGGILFLDEIAELPLDSQAMLLTAIETKKFRRPHSTVDIQCDFMLICGTNKDLWEEVKAKRFRLDLLERINTWHFHLPGLAEKERPGYAARRKDIALNCQQVLSEYNKKYSSHLEFANDALQRFIEYAEADTTEWKGNFREFNAMIFRMATFANGLQIELKGVEKEIERTEFELKSYKTDSNVTAIATDAPPAATKQEEFPTASQTINTPDPTSPLPDASCRFEFLRELLGEKYAELRLDELAQLAFVASVCADAKNQADASRRLRINQSDAKDGSPQLFKYLYHLGLNFDKVKSFARGFKPSDSSQVRR